MDEFTGICPSVTQGLAWLFAQSAADESGPAVLPRLICPDPGDGPAFGSAALPADWPGQPPCLEGPADLQAAQAWLRAERARLEQFTRAQFAQLEQRHNDLLAQHYRSEAEMTVRTQEVNREMQFLAAQVKALRE